jgi:DNA-binding MarR family transcriptional regulator
MGVQTRILGGVSSRLQDELKQTRPWDTLEEEAALNIARTAAILDHETAQVMKPFGVTPTQYNVLRILRGAGESGLCRNEVGERLVRQVPDVTRLLDRMEEVGWIDRRRSESDRRFVTTVITARGSALLAELDGPIVAFHRQRLSHMGEEQLRAVVALMEGIRNTP